MLANPHSVLVFVMFLWTSGLVVSKSAASFMTPFELSFSRWVICSLILLIFCYTKIGNHISTIRGNFSKLFVLGFLLAMGSTFLIWSVDSTTVFNASLLGASQPLITLIMAFVIGLESTSRIQYLGILLGLMGVVVLITEASSDLIANFRFNLGDVLVLAAVMFYSLYTVCLVKWRLQLPSYIIMTTSSVSASLILFPLTISHSGFAFIDLWFDPIAILIIFFMAVFPTALATSLWNRAVINIGANKASVFINLMPVFGALASILIFDDRFKLFHFYGTILVVIGVWMVAFRKDSSK
ncbi:MAG: DMT family transporter [Pseudomonadota bacterium]|nr:DMT family transporter [Pseudomonadota bacterium]